MSIEIAQGMITLEAAADLSTKQYYLVTVDANGKAALCGNNANAVGVLQNKPTAGQAATIQTAGISKISQSADLTPGDVIASDANGQAKVAAALGQTIGTLLIDAGAANGLGSILIQKGHFAAS